MSQVLQRLATSGTRGWCVWGLGLAVLASSCEPDWNELTSEAGETARGGGGSGSSGSPATSGSPNHTDGGTLSTGGSGAAAGAPTDSGGEPSAAGAGGGGSPAIGPEAIDLPGVASADSEETNMGNVAANGHDGDNATRWVAADGALGHYWTLDLGSPHSLARVTIRWEYPHGLASAAYLYTVSVSDDGVTYEVALDKSNNAETTQDQVAELPPGTTGRYARITVTGLPPPTPGVYWASFYEARVFGFPQ
jgi:hypothetical protein